MCSGSEAGLYLRLIDFVYHSTLGLRIIIKKKKQVFHAAGSGDSRVPPGGSAAADLPLPQSVCSHQFREPGLFAHLKLKDF